MELPSISGVQTRGPTDVPYYNAHAAQRPLHVSEKLPSLPLPQPQQAYSTGASSPRVSSISSSTSSNAGSLSSFTSAVSSDGPKTPPPNLPLTAHLSAPQPHYEQQYHAMNSTADMYYTQHMSAGQAPPPQTVTSGNMPYHNPHQQPTLLQPGPAQYSAAPYGQPYYPNGLTSPPAGPQSVSNSMGPAPNVLPLPGVGGGQPGMQNQYQGFDTTGQVAPPGMKPRVTATLWEDEGSLCFQVEARGICVARREDNHMINGTKLLNVAGMTRGRRDGILKSEKVRHVVKIGPMHLKGVWIPFERALDFANKEKITEMLYPLFVHNIGALLLHPTNQSRTHQVMAAAERRKHEGNPQNQMRNVQGPSSSLPSLQQHHHHSMALPGPQPPLPSHGNMTRPSLDRAHTFPTPPTSASSVMGGMGASDNFQWQPQQGMNGGQGANHMSMENGLSNARSMPATPATTPPGSALQGMQQQYPPVTQTYDNSRQMYSSQPTQQSPYPPANSSPQDRSIYQSNYAKNDMGPPSSRAVGGGAEPSADKPINGMMQGQPGDAVPHPVEESEHDHETEYTHDSGAYDGSRAQYSYNPPPVASLAGEHSHISPEMTGTGAHQAASGRSTPRSAAAPQSYYTQSGYNTPPRAPQTSSNLYSVISSDRGPTNGAPAADVYASQPDMSGSMQNGYAAVMNGTQSAGMKRGRDDDDDRSGNGGAGMGLDMKRRKTLIDGTLPSAGYDAMSRAAPPLAAQRRR